VFAAFAFLHTENGIAYSGGAEFALILCSAALLLSLALLLGTASVRWLRISLGLLLTGCLLGAAVSAYFLEAAAVLAFLLVAMLCWLVAAVRRGVASRSAAVGRVA
jgi:hypothetical protein